MLTQWRVREGFAAGAHGGALDCRRGVYEFLGSYDDE